MPKVNAQVQGFFEAQKKAYLKLTYDDVRLDSNHSNVLPSKTNLQSRITRRINAKIPMLSSPMDTVTESRMAIAMAVSGGIGVIHRGLSPEDQSEEVARVKLHLNGLIEKPICVSGDDAVADVLLRRKMKGYAFHRFPVVDSEKRLMGLITKDDFDLCDDPSRKVAEIMTPVAKLETASASIAQQEAYDLMQRHKKKALPLVDAEGRLVGMYAFSDLRRIYCGSSMHNLDARGHLRVGAAVGAGADYQKRALLLAERGCDLFQIDTAHGDSDNVFDAVKYLKKQYPHIDILAGNVSNGAAAKRLADAGADGILVGQGPGSICTTRMVAGIGVPQVSAVYDCVHALQGLDVPVCADGGITNSGDIVIALAIGAESVMLGRALAGTDEAPGDTRTVQGVKVKAYRGMGSLGAMRDNASSRERYGQAASESGKFVPEGVEGVVPYQGTLADVLRQYVGGVQQGLGYQGAANLIELRERVSIFRFTGAGLKESRPHDVLVTELPPNYRGN